MEQYIINYEGNNNGDNSEDNEITNTFNALVVDIDFSALLDKNNQTTVYYTLYSKIKLKNVTATALKLANKAYNHVITTINIITDTFSIDADPFTYNTTLHYTSVKFIGIMIDTKALKCSTVGYS